VELSDLVASIRRYWLPIVLIPLIAVAAVWKTRPPETYTASATVQVFPAGGVNNLNDGAVSLLMPAVVVRADSQAFANTVGLSLPATIADAPVTRPRGSLLSQRQAGTARLWPRGPMRTRVS